MGKYFQAFILNQGLQGWKICRAATSKRNVDPLQFEKQLFAIRGLYIIYYVTEYSKLNSGTLYDF